MINFPKPTSKEIEKASNELKASVASTEVNELAKSFTAKGVLGDTNDIAMGIFIGLQIYYNRTQSRSRNDIN